MYEARYFPMMSETADPLYGLAPTEPCWADIMRPWGPTGTCALPGDFALGLCEEHAYEILGEVTCSLRRSELDSPALPAWLL